MKLSEYIVEEFTFGKYIGGERGIELADSNGDFPKYGYRVMHHKEWDAAKELGFFDPSDTFYQRIHVSAEPKITYRDGRDKHYVVRFLLSPEDGWSAKQSGEGEIYGVTWERVPFSRAEIVEEL